MILNLILRSACGQHPFEKIVVVHCDPQETKEYDDLECELRADIPAPKDFPPHQKTLCILEDLNYLNMSNHQLYIQLFLQYQEACCYNNHVLGIYFLQLEMKLRTQMLYCSS